LIKRLLTFNRKQENMFREISLNSLVRETQTMLRPVIREGIAVVSTLEAAPDTILADPEQLEPVVINLVMNAVDAMQEGGKLVLQTANSRFDDEFRKRHSKLRAGDYVLLMVSDTGTGMSSEVKSRLFEPLFTRKEARGSGLGLWMAHRVIKRIGG